MLDIRDLTKQFGTGDSAVTALHQVSLSIAEGEFLRCLALRAVAKQPCCA